MSFQPFAYRGLCKKMDWATGQLVAEGAVHDGDSCWLFMDKGNREFLNANCRLYGVNAYELNDKDAGIRQRAVEARTWLRAQIEGKQVFILSKGLEKYGRPLAIIWLNEADFGNNSKSANKALLDAGHAIPYMGELI